MARRSRSRSPIHRERSRYNYDERRDFEESRRRKYREDEEERDVRNERYQRRRYEDDEDRYKGEDRHNRRSEPRERDRSLEPSRRGERDRRDHDGGNRNRNYDYREKQDRERNRDRDDDHRAGPSSSRRRSKAPSSARSRSHSWSRSPTSDKEEHKGKPNFNQSGLLAAATNTVRLADGTSTVLKYNEPPEARKPTVGWRLYAFKGKEQTDVLHIHRQSCYLIGRDKAIADIYVEHPSCSKQHAAIQYRQVQEKDELGSSKAVVKPFIIDLESTNNTFVNEEAIPAARYYELKMGDVIKFGMSTREYVLLHDDV